MMIEVIIPDDNDEGKFVSDNYQLIYKDDKKFNVENVQSNFLVLTR